LRPAVKTFRWFQAALNWLARRYHLLRCDLTHDNLFFLGQSELYCARAEIGYANTRLYRRLLAEMSGQPVNPVKEAKDLAEDALERTLRLAEGMSGRRECLFQAHVTCALASVELGDWSAAQNCLDLAKRLDPAKADQDARFLFTQAVSARLPESEVSDLLRATALDPRFEVSRSKLAKARGTLWQRRQSLDPETAREGSKSGGPLGKGT
jgi:hypothetical protein